MKISNTYQYTTLPLNPANKQASNNNNNNKHFANMFWQLLRLVALGSTLV